MVKKLLALACASAMLMSTIAYAADDPSNGGLSAPGSQTQVTTTTTGNTTSTSVTTTTDTVTVENTTDANIPEDLKKVIDKMGSYNNLQEFIGAIEALGYSVVIVGDVNSENVKFVTSFTLSVQRNGEYDGNPVTASLTYEDLAGGKPIVNDGSGVRRNFVAFRATDLLDEVKKQNDEVDLSGYVLVVMNPVIKKIALVDLGKEENIAGFDKKDGTIRANLPFCGLVALAEKVE